MIARERAWAVAWVESCEHTAEHSDALARLDEGSEHIVYLAPGGKEVIKLTKPGVYGDSYYLVDGRVHQRCCTPGDYLIGLAMLQLKSYDIQLARLAGLPPEIIARAEEILSNLEQHELNAEGKPTLGEAPPLPKHGKPRRKKSAEKALATMKPQMTLF